MTTLEKIHEIKELIKMSDEATWVTGFSALLNNKLIELEEIVKANDNHYTGF